MKKLRLILFLLILMLGLCGCTSFVTIGSFETNTANKMAMKYFKFNGTKETTLTVHKGEKTIVNADIVTKKGTLDVFIYKDKDNYDYEGHDLETSNFSVTLSEPGIYTIKVKAKNHKGSYTFTWESNK